MINLTNRDKINLHIVLEKLFYVWYYFTPYQKKIWFGNSNNELSKIVDLITLEYVEGCDGFVLTYKLDSDSTFSLIGRSDYYRELVLDIRTDALPSGCLLNRCKSFKTGCRRSTLLNWICEEMFDKQMNFNKLKKLSKSKKRVG